VKLILSLVICCLSFGASFAQIIDLADGFNGKSRGYYLRTLKSGQSVHVRFPHGAQFVDTIRVAIEGKQRRYSFAKVYADGQEVGTLGIPGRDPAYPITIRERVSSIEIVAEQGSRFKINSFKIFTQRRAYQKYSHRRISGTYSLSQWGTDVLNIVHELKMYVPIYSGAARGLFLNLKKTAIRVEANDRIRDPRSLKTLRFARELVANIQAVEDYLFESSNFIVMGQIDYLLLDLLTIKEDIIERYDLGL
jgi:hypothetical protein